MSIKNCISEYKYHIENGVEKDFSLFGAFPDCGEIRFEIKADDGLEITSAVMILHSDGLECEDGERYLEYPMEQKNGCDSTYFVCIRAEDLKELSDRGLYYYKYKVESGSHEAMYGGEGVTELECGEDVYHRQLLLYGSDFTTPDFMKQGTVYHIFVDRFCSSGKCHLKAGAVLNPDWDNGVPQYAAYRGAPLKNNEFFGGDLWGVAEKLDYIKSLGVTVIYLSPVFDAASNHKYDTGNYMAVDSMFGGDEALSHLCEKCREAGIKIFLDGVFNHTGSDSIYFNKNGNYDSVGAYNSKDSQFYEWYNFYDYPDKYECWWNIDILPRVKTDSEGFREHILGDGGVVRKYMKMGVSGFRLDVADELSDSFLEKLREVVKDERPDGLVLGEVWEDASNKIAYGHRRTYFNGTQLDSVMNYPLRNGVISFIKEGDADGLRFVMETVYRHYPKCVSDVLMNFLGTHDTERILTVLGDGESGDRSPELLAKLQLTDEQLENAKKRLKCAYTLIAGSYGIPSVFYGDEAGLEGYHDPFCRRPYPWKAQNTEILDFYRRIGNLRLQEHLFSEGCFRVVKAEKDVFMFERFSDTEKITVAVTRESAFAYDPQGDAYCLFDSNEKAAMKKECSFMMLQPWSAYIFKQTTAV